MGMLAEDTYVRTIGTDELGVVIEQLEDGRYDVGLSNRGPARRDQCWFTADANELQEVVETSLLERGDVARAFDLVTYEVEMDDGSNGAVLAISQTTDGYSVRIYSFTGDTDVTMTLSGDDALDLRLAFQALETHGWVQGFYPDELVRDGYWWRLDVYAAGRFYTCGGESTEPEELVAFFELLAGFGAPRLFGADGRPSLK